METKDGVVQAQAPAPVQLTPQMKVAQFDEQVAAYQQLDEAHAVERGYELIEANKAMKSYYIERRRIFNRELPVSVPVVETAVTPQTQVLMAEPQMSDKDRKKLKERKENNLKAGLKLTQNATYATVDILEAEKKRVKSEAELSGLMAKAVPALKAHVTPQKFEQQLRTLGPLMEFAPGYEFDEKGIVTSQTKNEVVEYINKVCNEPDKVMNEIKNKMFDKVFEPSHYTAEYIGDHYEEMRKEVDQVKAFLLIFKEKSPEYNALKEDEKLRVDMLSEQYTVIKGAFESAISCHGIKIKNNRAEVSSDAKDTDINEATVQAIGVFKEKRQEQIRATWDGLIEEFTQSERARIEQTLRQDYDAQKAAEPEKFVEDGTDIFRDLTFNGYLLEEIAKAKKLIDSQPDQYAQNKENIDIIFKAIQDAMSSQKYFHIRAAAMDDAAFKASTAGIVTPEFIDYMKKKQVVAGERMNELNRHIGDLFNILYHFVYEDEAQKTKLGIPDCVVMEQLGIHSDMLDEVSQYHEENAMYYAETYRAKEKKLEEAAKRVDPTAAVTKYTTGVMGRALMLMKMNDDDYNDSIVGLLRDKIQLEEIIAGYSRRAVDGVRIPLAPQEKALEKSVMERSQAIVAELYARVESFDMEKLNDPTDDELEEMNKLLTDMNMAAMMTADLGKMSADDDRELASHIYRGEEEKAIGFAVTIKEKVLGKPVRASFDSQEAFDKAQKDYELRVARMRYKLSAIDSYARKARGVSIMRSALLGSPNTNMLISAEVRKAKADQSEEAKVLGMAQIFIDKGDEIAWGNRERLARNPAIIHGLPFDATKEKPTYHQVVHDMEVIEDKLEKAGVAIYKGKLHTIDFSSSIRECVQIIGELTMSIEAGTLDVAEEQAAHERIEELRNLSQIAAMKQRLVVIGKYEYAGGEQIMSEAMFRSFDSTARIPALRDMPEDEYREMLRQLSEGAMLTKNSSEEEVKAAKQVNKAGFATYYRTIAKHYDAMEKKYGYKLMDLDFFLEHAQEILRDTANIQVDTNLADHEELMNEPNGEFERLRNQIIFYDYWTGAVLIQMYTLKNEHEDVAEKVKTTVDYQRVRDEANAFLKQGDKHLSYLKSHPLE